MTPPVAAVRVHLRASRWLTAFLCIVHSLAAAVLVPLDIGFLPKLVLLAAVVASLAHGVWRHGLLRARSAIVQVQVNDAERAAVLTRGGAWRDVDILGTTYVSERLTVLNLRVPGRRFARHVILVSDNVDSETFRRLRVVLRWAHPRQAS